MSNGSNSFGVGYSEIVFFESVLRSHAAAAGFERSHDIRFDIERINGMSNLSVILVSEYRLGEAFAYRVLSEFQGVDIIVNNGKWNAVVLDRVEFKENTGVEVLQLSQFMGALNNPSTGR
jgi:hypothetical protein